VKDLSRREFVRDAAAGGAGLLLGVGKLAPARAAGVADAGSTTELQALLSRLIQLFPLSIDEASARTRCTAFLNTYDNSRWGPRAVIRQALVELDDLDPERTLLNGDLGKASGTVDAWRAPYNDAAERDLNAEDDLSTRIANAAGNVPAPASELSISPRLTAALAPIHRDDGLPHATSQRDIRHHVLLQLEQSVDLAVALGQN
jgi:hypothetical protein